MDLAKYGTVNYRFAPRPVGGRTRRWATGGYMRRAGVRTEITAGVVLAALLLGVLNLGRIASHVHGASTLHRARERPTAAMLDSMPEARTFRGTPAVGALFIRTASGQIHSHYCTASVVSSPDRDLIMTAAHCVSGLSPNQIAYVPAYHKGLEPYGVWDITQVFVNSAWTKSRDPDDDFAFLVVSRSSSGARVQSVTGGDDLGVGRSPVETVDVIGYPIDKNAPITCTNQTTLFKPTQLRFVCGGYTGGTSGGPFLVHVRHKTGLGTLIGVVGGYEEGGDSPSVSYAARLLAAVSALYTTAAASPAAAAG